MWANLVNEISNKGEEMDKIWEDTLNRVSSLEKRMARIEQIAEIPSTQEPQPAQESQQENKNDKVDNVDNPAPTN